MTALVLSFVVLGNHSSTIDMALDTLDNLCFAMKESKGMCHRVLERLQFIWNELQTVTVYDEHMLLANDVLSKYSKMILNFVVLLKKHSRKKLLSRLASSRTFVEEIQGIHTEIDSLFQLLNLVHSTEMLAWRQQWKSDLESQLELLQQRVGDLERVTSELHGGALVEALINIRYEIEMNAQSNTPEHLELMRETFNAVVQTSNVQVPAIPTWFIQSDDVVCSDESFASGSYGTVYRGTWTGTNVVIKRLLATTEAVQKAFVMAMDVWSRLHHPHVLKLFGANHVTTPLFVVCEDATQGNFVEYFRDPDNKRSMWQLFYQTATGLEYLHKNKVVHGALKCRNLLVGADGMAKICNVGFRFIRTQSIGLLTRSQTDAVRWLAPECLLGDGVEANPSFASDVYAFGMCIIEAVSGEVPWGLDDDDTILENLLEGTFHPRPDGLFTDK